MNLRREKEAKVLLAYLGGRIDGCRDDDPE